MYITKKIQTETEVVIGFECSRCKKVFDADDIVEMQECVHIHICGGYGSLFGDGNEWEITFCQRCADQTIGAYLEPVEEEDETYLTYDQAKQILEWERTCSWRKVAEYAAEAFPELGIDSGNQIDGRALCDEAMKYFSEENE